MTTDVKQRIFFIRQVLYNLALLRFEPNFEYSLNGMFYQKPIANYIHSMKA